MKLILYFSGAMILIGTLFSFQLWGQEIVINEFMSDNEITIQDEDGDFSDWIELYNPNDHTINLWNYGLSDNVGELGKWIFPSIDLPGHGFLLIFASGKERQDSSELHTNFKISSGGETLYLVNSAGVIIDETINKYLADDKVMARIPDGSDHWFESSNPTPGSSNETENQLLFSSVGGFFSAPFYLKITSVLGDTVFYTLDGSIPTDSSGICVDSLFMDDTYTKPNYYSEIPTSPEQRLISYHAWESPDANIDKANIVRCASFRNGMRTSEIYTHTYFVDSNIFSKYSMPVISLVTESANFFGFDKGIYVPGKMQEPNNPGVTGNYYMKGEAWERPIHNEYSENNGHIRCSQNAGARIHGGLTRHAGQKTLRVYAREEYGESCFNYQLLSQKPVNSYKRFLLRTTMGGSSIDEATIRDVVAHEIVRDLDIEIQDYQPVIVYINGEYWGIHTLRDRIDERYIEYTFGFDKDSIDMINANIALVDAGSNAHYKRVAEYIDQNDLSVDFNYEYVKSQIDIHSLVDYVIAEMFLSNWDWPGNNQKLWRPQTPEGKWRWIFFDLDVAYSHTITDIFDHAMLEEGERPWNTESVSSLLLRNLLKNNNFRSLFIDRFAEILNKEFSQEKMMSKLNAIMDLYRLEIPRHCSRWHYPASIDSWEDDIENHIVDFLVDRPCEVAKQIINYFDLEEFAYNCYGADHLTECFIVAPNPSNGQFFIQNNSANEFLGYLLITDVTGKVVFFEQDVLLTHYERKHYDLSRLSGGSYFVKYVTDQRSCIIPIVIL